MNRLFHWGTAVVVFACVAAKAIAGAPASSQPTPSAHPFAVAMYNPVSVTMQMKDPQWLARSYDRLSSQVRFDKIYIENYRSRRFADDDTLDAVKQFFLAHHVQVAGGMALDAGAIDGQFQSPCYTNESDRAMVKKAAEQAARHFDEIILDDFFFNTTKTESDIKAKGDQSWTEFRLKLMNEVAEDLVIKPAKAVNPKVKIVIKFPNWYEHFAGLGYDLEQEPREFDGIYTGTETRDPLFSEQHLQAYESYEIVRYFDQIAPGRNGGGWVDPYDQRSIDRYAEQLWDTALAKAPEITLFNYVSLLEPLQWGDRGLWENQQTSLTRQAVMRHAPPGEGLPSGPDIAAAAGAALQGIEPLVSQLGHPIGIASERPYHALGEDFLHNFLGMVGIPIELQPTFPQQSDTVLLTESAKFDPNLVAQIKQHLLAGHDVVITSGLLRALQHTGAPGDRIQDIAEMEVLDAKASVTQFEGPGGRLLTPAAVNPGILIPQVRFLTNDAWGLVMGLADGNGFPLLVSDRYGKGQLFVLTVPDNFEDLYRLPPETLAAIRRVLLKHFPVRVDGPAQVSVFAYDNDTFVVESYLPTATTVAATVNVPSARLRDLTSGQLLNGSPAGAGQTVFSLPVHAHSYRGFAIQR